MVCDVRLQGAAESHLSMSLLHWHRSNLALVAALLALGVLCGCNMDGGGRSVADAWEAPAAPQEASGDEWSAAEGDASARSDRRAPLPIATVMGRAVSRERMLGMLMRSHGLNVLEQLIAMELVRQAAEAAGLAVTPADIRAEYDRAVARISSPVPATTQPDLGEDARETVLAEILVRRGLSREEFNLAMERQAYLRKLAARRLKIDDAMLQTQYEMMYAERVQVRHIQLAQYRDLAKVQRLLEAGGDFAEIAKIHSRNPRTAPEGGLLPPFSRTQDDVPPALREAAFQLQLGQVSNPIRINSDYHLIVPVKRFPKSNVKLEHVRAIVRSKLIERLLPDVMARLERDLFERSRRQIVITDPALRKQFQDKYPPVQGKASGDGR